MAKWSGKIGFAINKEIRPGVWEDAVVEKNYYGDILKRSIRQQSSDKVIDDFTINVSLSIVADNFLNENIGYMKYVQFMGTRWKIESIDPQYPRLTLNLGGMYNGPTPTTT